MSDLKITGMDDIRKIRARHNTWEPPASLDDYLSLVRKVITSSKYTDGFARPGTEITPQDLMSYVRMKTRRICEHPDLEECIDVAAYAYMLFHRLMMKLDEQGEHGCSDGSSS